MSSLSKRILLSITGRTDADWQNKLLEIEKFKIKRIALFLEMFSKQKRKEIYSALLGSCVKEVPFVHAKNEMNLEEFKFLAKNFRTKFFNIHENSFQYLRKWKGTHKKLLLELNYNNQIPSSVNLRKIGGFCIDLSHFKCSKERKSAEYFYVLKKRKLKNYFIANHLNGYSEIEKKDLHKVKSMKEFDYLRTLPRFLFGTYIALEVFNPISEQIKFKRHICNFLENYL